ncbi:MAG TPA: hypothetical protein PKA32_00120 [Candidatus Gracilibacteria bacterium]|nr:hypothetical protein [Candidatus Gracilibacteria bacterium]
MQKRTSKRLIFFASIFFLATSIMSGMALAATSTITVTSSPYLSFVTIPESFSMANIVVPTSDLELTSDSNGVLPPNRWLTIQDNRGCGGLNLQLQANDFTPISTEITTSNLRVVTSASTFYDGPTINNITYNSGFVGDQTATAPLNAGTINFSNPTTFTSLGNNSLDVPRDLIDGTLTAPTGRQGQMHFGLSFYLFVPKYTSPGNYYTKLTYTLSDDTSGSCP